MISEKCELTAEEIKLIFRGKIMKNPTDTMADLKIKSGNTLHMVRNKLASKTTTPSNFQIFFNITIFFMIL